MKFVSYKLNGLPKFGAFLNESVYDLTQKIGCEVSTLKQLLEKQVLPSTEEILELGKIVPVKEIEFLPVIPDPDKIICVGVNYEEHRKETKRPKVNFPTLFTRFSESQIGHLQSVIKPKQSEKLDFEGELAVIIGHSARNISENQAMSCVAGFSCFNDVTVRDWQRHSSQFTPGKNFSGTGSLGPFMTTISDVPDYRLLKLETRLNKKRMQTAELSQLIFSIPEIISYCSSFTKDLATETNFSPSRPLEFETDIQSLVNL